MIINISEYPIINAFYGNKSNKINVIDIVLKNLNNKVCVNNQIFKRDPCYGKKKKLYITLKNNKKYEIDENSTFTIINNKKYNHSKKLQINKEKIIHTSNINKNINIDNKFNYILSTNVRDENNILEFLVYHLMIGFDKILVIDHLSQNNVTNIIKTLPSNYKDKIEVLQFNKEGSYKLHFLNDIVIPYMKKNCNKYFIHLDGDEYINLNNNYKNISSLLEDFKYPDILALNWLLFGSNNKDINDNEYKCLIPTYTKCNSELSSHFKILININIIGDNTYFINPHQIYQKNKTLIYTNISNIKINFNDKNKIYNLFNDSIPKISINKAKAYINHYIIQSKEDYNKRKIKRNRDDIEASRQFNKNTYTMFNNIVNNNLINYYTEIKKIFTREKIGFIILRYVINNETNKMWIKCYNSIRKFYNNKIMIIDDNSKKEYITNKKLQNCFIIDSNFKGRGELLPYYYYLKNYFCERVVVLHDSMTIEEKIDFENIINFKNFTRIFSFSNNCYNIDIKYFKIFCNTISNGDYVYQYHIDNKKKLLGCFGVCYIIDYNFLKKINDKYNIQNLVKVIDSRDKRKTLERFFSCLFEIEHNSSKLPHLLGSIFETLKKQKLNENVLIYKNFYGR
tara:strand:- start:34898 stop:36772 length:1875 start_codon:yes stop_codon:yes gene_type:complete